MRRVESQSACVREGLSNELCTHGISNVMDDRFVLLLYVPAPEASGIMFDITINKLVKTPPRHFNEGLWGFRMILERLERLKF